MSDAVLTTLISSGCLLAGTIVTAVLSVKNGKTAKKTNKTIEDVDKKLDKHIYEDKIEKAKSARSRILRYNDEILNGVRHSKEMADACLIDCTYYEQACDDIPNFQNNIATMAIENIKRDYQEAMLKNSFL